MAGLSDWETEIEDRIKQLESYVGLAAQPPTDAQVNVGAAHVGNADTEPPPATDAALALAEEHNVDLAQVEPSGASGQITKPDVEAVIPQ